MKNKTRRRLIIVGVIVAVLFAGFLWVRQMQATAFKTLKESSTLVTVKKGDLTLYSLAKGSIVSASVKNVSFSGNLKENLVSMGDQVKKNQLLGTYTDYLNQTKNIRASVAGVITMVPSAISPAYSISNPNLLQMSVQISEKDIAKISLNQSAFVYVDALSITIDGIVSDISYIGNTTQDYTTFTVTVSFDKGENAIFLGMIGSAKIETLKKVDILTIPVEALIEYKGLYYVLSADWFNHSSQKQSDYYLEVKVGNADINTAEVSGTDLEGQEVIILPAQTSFGLFARFRQ